MSYCLGPGLVFIVYPEAIATMHGSVFWAILFFVMLITLGLDSTVSYYFRIDDQFVRHVKIVLVFIIILQFGGLEAMITGLCDEYPHVLRKNREIFVAILILGIYLCALPTTTYVKIYI